MRHVSVISRDQSCVSPDNKLLTAASCLIYLSSAVSASRKCFTLVPCANYSTVKYRPGEVSTLLSVMHAYRPTDNKRLPGSVCTGIWFVIIMSLLCVRWKGRLCWHTVVGQMPTGTGNGLEDLPLGDHKGHPATTEHYRPTIHSSKLYTGHCSRTYIQYWTTLR